MASMHGKPGVCAQAVLTLALVTATLAAAFAQQVKKPATPAAIVPGFSVNITYSQKAMDTLVTRKETVIVAGYLSGFPQKGTPKNLVDHMGEIGLGEVKQEIVPGAGATFDHIKLARQC